MKRAPYKAKEEHELFHRLMTWWNCWLNWSQVDTN